VLYEDLKFKDVKTYIQSGNVIFKSTEKLSDEGLAKRIEEAIFKKYKFDVPVIIRSEDEMRQIISENPFLKEKNIDEKKLHVTFLSEIPSEETAMSIQSIDFPPDRFIIRNKEIYLSIPGSYGETKISNAFFEKKLKIKATTRNWNTVNKLSAMAAG
jgi:uncharacterized protein (DUF1697 family)